VTSELGVSLIDEALSRAVARNIGKSVRLFCLKCEQSIAFGEDATQLIGKLSERAQNFTILPRKYNPKKEIIIREQKKDSFPKYINMLFFAAKITIKVKEQFLNIICLVSARFAGIIPVQS
jgi:hypothetical protein